MGYISLLTRFIVLDMWDFYQWYSTIAMWHSIIPHHLHFYMLVAASLVPSGYSQYMVIEASVAPHHQLPEVILYILAQVASCPAAFTS